MRTCFFAATGRRADVGIDPYGGAVLFCAPTGFFALCAMTSYFGKGSGAYRFSIRATNCFWD